MPSMNDDIVLTKDNVKEILNNIHTIDTMFMNSDCLFVEYHDIIKMPWFILICMLHQNQKIKPIIDISKIDGLTDYEIMEWYCKRINRNPLIDLASAPLDKVDYDQLLDVLMGNNEVFYLANTELNAVKAIKTALSQKMVKEVVIYTEKENPIIKKDIQSIFGNRSNVSIKSGNLTNVLEKIPTNSSYMLSDFNKVVTMANCGKLNLASLILPFDYSYNFVLNENGEKTPIVNFDYLGGTSIFKMHYFNACYV